LRTLMLVMSDVVGDARVRREASSLAAAGIGVHVLGLGPNSTGAPPSCGWPTGMTVEHLGSRSPFPSGGSRHLGPLTRFARWGLLPLHRRARERSYGVTVIARAQHLQFDVVHAHDFPTLAPAADLATARGVPLIYDAHECWRGRRREERPTPWEDRSIRDHEARLGARAAAVLTVSEALAAWLRSEYGWDHVRVVRNTFPFDVTEPAPIPSRATGAVYAGRIGPGRDLHTIASAARAMPDIDVTLVGVADPRTVTALGRGIRIVAPIDIDDVDRLLSAAGLALITLEDGPLNHRLALPNKLFQAVRAGVPVVAADLPELGGTVRRHGLGTLYEPGSPASLVAALQQARDEYPDLLAAVHRARPAFDWSHDERELISAYRSADVARIGRS